MHQNSLKIKDLVLHCLLIVYAHVKKYYVKDNSNKKPIYQLVGCYRKSTGEQMITAKVVDAPRGVFKLPALDLILNRKDILSGFSVDDVINILGLATTEKQPITITKRTTTYKYYTLLTMLFGAALITANVAASKLISVFGLTLTGGSLVYPVTYFLGNIIAEVYGYKRSRQVIWGAMVCNLFLVLFLHLVIIATPSEFWHNQQAYADVLGAIPRVVIASLIGTWSGEFVNAYCIARFKVAQGGNNLALRIITSSIIGIGVDTFLFIPIAYFNAMPTEEVFHFAIRIFIRKLLFEFISFPLAAWLIHQIKAKEHIDIFDINTKFTPFSLDAEYSDYHNKWGKVNPTGS